MKQMKRIIIVIISLPFILIGFYILFEIFGMCVNHISTDRQTKELTHNLTKAIADVEITDVYSETGNTSGTGNHVDSLSIVTFSSKKSLSEIKDSMSEYYEWDKGSCFVEERDGSYVFYLNTSAPFADNIEGH